MLVNSNMMAEKICVFYRTITKTINHYQLSYGRFSELNYLIFHTPEERSYYFHENPLKLKYNFDTIFRTTLILQLLKVNWFTVN